MKSNEEINNIKNEIIQHIDEPKQLELLYRKNKTSFQRAFNSIYLDIKINVSAEIWNERLNYQEEEINRGIKGESIVVVAIALLTGLLAKIPNIFKIDLDYFFARNLGLVALPLLMIYFIWKQKLEINKILLPLIVVIVSGIYINLLPDNSKSDTLILASIHLPILLWTILGYTFTGGDLKSNTKKIEFLRYNGDLVVMVAVMLLSGALFSAITFGLFELIQVNIQNFYADYVIVWGLSTIPILATFLVRNNPQLVSKISPVIAKIFTPLVAILLLIFLSAFAYTGKNIYQDREFLMVFNALLIGVMAIILFSISEATKNNKNKTSLLFLLVLSILTIITNGIAVSAILFRMFEYGMTPNRLAVLGSNILIFINIIWITYRLLTNIKGKTTSEDIENTIAVFLPIYGLWTAIVTFVFPVVFGFK